MTDIFDAGSDDEAIAGEHVGYVPCTDAAFAGDADDDSEAIDGSDAGYVADGTEAGDFADGDDGQAVYGSAVGFIAKPCCGVRDTFTRTRAVGWDETDSGEAWTSDPFTSVDGSAGLVSYPADTPIIAYQTINSLDLSGVPSGYTFSFRFDYVHPTNGTSIYGRVIGSFAQELGGGVSVSGAAGTRSSIFLNTGLVVNVSPSFWITGTWYTFRYAYDGTDGMARVWKTADPEPSAWDVTQVVTTPPAMPLTFYAQVQESAGGTWPDRVYEWDDLCIVF